MDHVPIGSVNPNSNGESLHAQSEVVIDRQEERKLEEIQDMNNSINHNPIINSVEQQLLV